MSFIIPTSFGPAVGLVAPKIDPINSFLSEATLAFFALTSHINWATDVPATVTGGALPASETTAVPATVAGVTGVNVGHSDLTIPYGANGYTTAADWYFPTQSDGSVQADGVIWLQHGFSAKSRGTRRRRPIWHGEPTAWWWCPTCPLPAAGLWGVHVEQRGAAGGDGDHVPR